MVDELGLLGGADAQVPGGGVERGVAEVRLDLRGVGAALAEPGGEGVAEPVWPGDRSGQRRTDGEHDLGDPGRREPAALPGPHRTGLAAALEQPGGRRAGGGSGAARTSSHTPPDNNGAQRVPTRRSPGLVPLLVTS